jgi:hypothetical protein
MNITPQFIAHLIARNPDGPVVLWRFRHLADASHANNLEILHGLCQENVIKAGGANWRITIKGGGAGGFVYLTKVAPAAPPNKRSLAEYKTRWAGELAKRGIAMQHGVVYPHNVPIKYKEEE